MVLDVGFHRHHRPRQSDNLRLHLGNDLLEPALCLPLRDFIFVTKILRFPLPSWLAFGSEPTLDLSEFEPRSISEPGGYGNGIKGVFLGMTVGSWKHLALQTRLKTAFSGGQVYLFGRAGGR